VLVRTAYGARISLLVGIGATATTIVVGLLVGLVTGYFGGIVDTVLARIIDMVLSIPYLLFAIALFAILGHLNIWLVMLAIAAFGWASVGRIIRGQVISMREREYIEAARSLGAGDWRIIFVDILPNVIAPAIVFSTLLLPVSVLSEAALSYLGVGIPPPTADWGADDFSRRAALSGCLVVSPLPQLGVADHHAGIQHLWRRRARCVRPP
jgi:peptide/nickel transport system permease protein